MDINNYKLLVDYCVNDGKYRSIYEDVSNLYTQSLVDYTKLLKNTNNLKDFIINILDKRVKLKLYQRIFIEYTKNNNYKLIEE